MEVRGTWGHISGRGRCGSNKRPSCVMWWDTVLQCVKNITLLSAAPASWKDAGELAPILAFLVGTIKWYEWLFQPPIEFMQTPHLSWVLWRRGWVEEDSCSWGAHHPPELQPNQLVKMPTHGGMLVWGKEESACLKRSPRGSDAHWSLRPLVLWGGPQLRLHIRIPGGLLKILLTHITLSKHNYLGMWSRYWLVLTWSLCI